MRVLYVVCVLALIPAAARATVIVPADLSELTRDARAIAVGRVVAVDGRWTDDRKTIETIVTLDVDQYLKGSLGATVQFRVPGGDLGRYRNIVVGAPGFAVDQHVIVFLGANGPMIPYIVGFNQGVYRVVRTADGIGWQVRGESPRLAPRPLAEFEANVRALAGAAK